eukprot:1030998-Rhodomonas_salina.1
MSDAQQLPTCHTLSTRIISVPGLRSSVPGSSQYQDHLSTKIAQLSTGIISVYRDCAAQYRDHLSTRISTKIAQLSTRIISVPGLRSAVPGSSQYRGGAIIRYLRTDRDFVGR